MNYRMQYEDAAYRQRLILDQAEKGVNTLNKKEFDSLMNMAEQVKEQKDKAFIKMLTSGNTYENDFSFSDFINNELQKQPHNKNVANLIEQTKNDFIKNNVRFSGTPIPLSVFNASSLSSANNGAELAQKRMVGFTGANYSGLRLLELGAQVFDNLTSTDFITSTDTEFTSSDLTETETAEDYSPTFSQKQFTPIRSSVSITVSDKLINSSTKDIKTLLEIEMIKPLMTRVQRSAIKNIIDNAGTVVSLATDGGALTYAKVLEAKKAVNNANVSGENNSFVTHPNVKDAASQIELSSGSGVYLWDQNNSSRFLGDQALLTTTVPTNLTKGTGENLTALVFGDFSGVAIGFWGGVDITFDKYTAATQGDIIITISLLYSTLLVKPNNFAVIKDIIV